MASLPPCLPARSSQLLNTARHESIFQTRRVPVPSFARQTRPRQQEQKDLKVDSLNSENSSVSFARGFCPGGETSFLASAKTLWKADVQSVHTNPTPNYIKAEIRITVINSIPTIFQTHVWIFKSVSRWISATGTIARGLELRVRTYRTA